MKKILFSLAVALFYISCSGDGNEPTSSSSSGKNSDLSSNSNNPTSGSSNGGNGDTLAENGQAMIPDKNGEADKPYTGNSKIYLADIRDTNNGNLILTEEAMLEAGIMSNGEVTLALPTNIDSRFLIKVETAPAGLNVEPLGVEIWFYNDPFRLLNNGKHTGDLEYAKISNGIYHKITYYYFSKDAKINGSLEEGGGIEFKIEAKEGWNKIYFKMNIEDESGYITTDLSEVPDRLAWLMWEVKS